MHEISKELDKVEDSSIFSKFYYELNLVLDELKILNQQKEQAILDKPKIDEITKNELFTKLKLVSSKRKAKDCKLLIQEIEKYQLSYEDEKIFENIKKLLNKYKFKDALEKMRLF